MRYTLALLILFTSLSVSAQQLGDESYKPNNLKRTIEKKEIVTVAIDAAHYNFHTMNGRYLPFSKVLKSDGYTVRENTKLFSKESLKGIDILVIANALNEKNAQNWSHPNYSAFTEEEVKAVSEWISNGGSLLLIADHMPFPKAAENLGAAFGFEFKNGYAFFTDNKESIFNIKSKSLIDHPIRRGMNDSESIKQVRTFTGQAFPCPEQAEKLLVFSKSSYIAFPSKSGQIDNETPKENIKGWCHAATVEYNKGRVAVFGEAAMFTNQRSGDASFGLGAIGAEQNEQFLLNVMHWLSRKI